MPFATAWHQRSAFTRVPRQLLRRTFFDLLRAAFATDDGRQILSDSLGDLLQWRPSSSCLGAMDFRPYPDVGVPPFRVHGSRPAPVFITARFRTGSTLLWNLFRRTKGCTAYYEPLNERRWFDPERRGSHVDSTHRHVDDYWREYDGLHELGDHYREDWIRRRLYMDELSWDPALAAYVRVLLDRAGERPVLQFNRIDFRLAWFRHTFPEAIIVHLFRHPRDQWCSCFPDWSKCSPTASMTQFASHDHFYLRVWASDLRHRFPFLDESRVEHPYELFCFLWKLSLLFGKTFAHYSVSFEDLVRNPELELRSLFRRLGIAADPSELAGIVKPSPSRWRLSADDSWYRRQEERCEAVLAEFFATPLRDDIGGLADYTRAVTA